MRLSTLQIFLIELSVWLAIWLLNDYVATLLALITGGIATAVLLFALIAEGIERSKVPGKYFKMMAITIIAPVVAGGIYLWIFGGTLSFLKN